MHAEVEKIPDWLDVREGDLIQVCAYKKTYVGIAFGWIGFCSDMVPLIRGNEGKFVVFTTEGAICYFLARLVQRVQKLDDDNSSE